MYTIYHIPGVKIGCSKRVEARVKEQGYNLYEVLEVCLTAREASEKELRWQEQLGYRKDKANYLNALRMASFSKTQDAIQKFKTTIKTSEEYKQASKQNLGKGNSLAVTYRRRKEVLQFNLNGNLIREWKGGVEAQKQLGLSTIIMCLTGRCKTAGGFIWKYKN